MKQKKNKIEQIELWERASKSIMTTDTTKKIVRRSCQIGSKTVHLVGIAKGSGII